MHDEKISECISRFIGFLSEAESKYSFYLEEMLKQDRLTQDYLHSLELDTLSYAERNRIATKLTANRKDRRYFKDKVEEYQAVVEFLDDKNNRKIINQLKEVLGKTRKIEKYHKDRVYVPKILKTKTSEKQAS